MANNCYTLIEAIGIEKIWDGKSFDTIIPIKENEYCNFIKDHDPIGMWGWRKNNWGCDGRIFYSEVKENRIQLLTAWNTPWYIVSKLSKLLGDVELKHFFTDQDNYGANNYFVVWKDGKMISAYVQAFDFGIEEYMEKEPLKVTAEFNS